MECIYIKSKLYCAFGIIYNSLSGIILKGSITYNSLLLEGGSSINGTFLKQDCIDEITVIQTPLTAETNDMPLFNNLEHDNYLMILEFHNKNHFNLII